MSTELVNIARKLNRQLDLGKGMFFNAEALALLAAIGVNDVIQQKSAEYLREQARVKSMRRGSFAIAAVGPATATPSSPSPVHLAAVQWPTAFEETPCGGNTGGGYRAAARVRTPQPTKDPQEEMARARAATRTNSKR